MKHVIVLMVIFILCAGMSANAENVVRHAVGVQFADVFREGLYTGEVNTNYMPNGFGVFEAQNDKGEKYIIVGDWVDGTLTGKEWMVWDNGEMNIGEYDCGKFISGIYYRGAVKNEYKKEDDATQGYTLDTVLQINMSSLDDESIIQLFSNILGSTPLKVDEGLIWTAIGKQFCGLNVQAVWAMLNADGTISTVSYLMETNGYNNTSDLDANREIVETLINRTNARLGKAGIPVLDGNRIAFSNFDENVITLIRGNVITGNSTTYAYTWDDSYAVVVDVKRDSLSILFTAPKQLGS